MYKRQPTTRLSGMREGIILLAGRLEKAMTSRIPDIRVVGGLLRKGSGIVAQSLAATLFNTPILILVFGQLSLVAPLTNVLVLSLIHI